MLPLSTLPASRDGDVPLTPFQRLEIAGIAVAVQLLHFARPFRRWTLAAIEQRDLVPACQRVVDLERASEAGAAEDEDAQRFCSGSRAGAPGQCRQGRARSGECAQADQVTTRGAHAAAPVLGLFAANAAVLHRGAEARVCRKSG